MEKSKNREHGKSSEGLSNQTRIKSSGFSRQSWRISLETGQSRPSFKRCGRLSLAYKILNRVSASLWRGARGLKGISMHWRF